MYLYIHIYIHANPPQDLPRTSPRASKKTTFGKLGPNQKNKKNGDYSPWVRVIVSHFFVFVVFGVFVFLVCLVFLILGEFCLLPSPGCSLPENPKN